MVKFGLIGAGRVGRTLASLLPTDQYQLGPVVNRTAVSARRAVRELGVGSSADSFEALSDCGVILIAIPDADVRQVAADLAATELRLHKKIILQTSRLYNSSDFAVLRERGAAVGSLQPLFIFSHPVPSLAGVHCAVEGDAAATRMARRMIRSWDGEFQLVRADQKIRLGVACSVISDFLPALLEMAVQQLSAAGFLKKRALRAMLRLLQSTCREFTRTGRRCRTGPLLEADAVQADSYVSGLSSLDPAAADAYCETASQVLRILGRSKDGFSFLESGADPGPRALSASVGGAK